MPAADGAREPSAGLDHHLGADLARRRPDAADDRHQRHGFARPPQLVQSCDPVPHTGHCSAPRSIVITGTILRDSMRAFTIAHARKAEAVAAGHTERLQRVAETVLKSPGAASASGPGHRLANRRDGWRPSGAGRRPTGRVVRALDRIARHAYKVTPEDIEALKGQGFWRTRSSRSS